MKITVSAFLIFPFLVNCIENTLLDREAMDGLAAIINEKHYDASALGNRDVYRLLDTRIEALDIFSNWGTSSSSPCIVWNTKRRKGPAAAVTMHDLACELFP